MLYPLLFQPLFQERIWGGRSLEQLYRKALPPRIPVGESWEISDRPEAQSIIQNGPLAGKSLQWLMQNHSRELLGEARPLAGRFPLLVKILDAREKLSLQVHPPAAQAPALGGEPKTEMWFITHAEPGAELYAGLRRGATRSEFEARLAQGSVEACFHRIPVRAGDAMFLPSGRVHAIGAGLVIFEIQQNSDTTYRVFDWNRRDSEGKSRALHVPESLACIDFSDFEPAPIHPPAHPAPEVHPLVHDPLFKVELATLALGKSLDLPLTSCCILAGVKGEAEIDGHAISIQPGLFSLLPAALKHARVKALSDCQILLAQPGA